jgi:protein-S-isoprenylcysteine O-methyltransferase Ste14
VGFGLVARNWLSVAVLLLTGPIAHAWRMRLEEGLLIEAFGQTYEAYKKKTWALNPFVW